MTTDIEQLEPKGVWRIFAGMAKVPRASKKEEQIRAHMRGVAESMGFNVRADACGNLLVEVPATPGCERAAPTVLQGHLDMVCEKNADVSHDFDHDPIQLVVDKSAEGEPIVRAEGTTLGADNGIGVALALAAAADPSVKHGPLEILLTTDEEAGMTGAHNLQPDFLKGRRMLNLDSEEDDRIYIGCAGGFDTNLSWDFPWEPVSGGVETVRVSVTGLRGGHSGGDIHENRANAIKLLARTMLNSGVDNMRIAAITGGSKRNAIPREASAVVVCPSGSQGALQEAAQRVQGEARHQSPDPNALITVEAGETVASAVSVSESANLINALAALPNGVLGMSPSVPGLVETSTNVSTVHSDSSDKSLSVVVGALSRSSSATWNDVTGLQIKSIGQLAGARVATDNGYPGWEPNLDSPTLKTCREVYESCFGEPAEVAAIHAGLECGLIGERVEGMDMVSFGPRIEGAHSPDEVVFIESVKKSWKYLVAVLARLAEA